MVPPTGPQWGGGRLFGALVGFVYENGRNWETKSQKIDPKVPNRPSWWNPDFRLAIRIFFKKKKWIFWPFFRFSANCKKGRFSEIPVGTRSVVNTGYFLGGHQVWLTKIRLLAIEEWLKVAKIWDEPQKMTPTSETETFFWEEKFFGVFLVLLWIKYSPRAESARAVTFRRCPHSGEGENFLTGQLNFF